MMMNSEKSTTLYVSDMDGTLLNSQSVISPATAAILSRVISAGALFTVATARTPATVVPLLSGVTEFTMRVCTVMFLPGLLGYRAVFFAEVIAWTGAAILLCACYFVRLHRMPRDDRGM